jgi:hypothetical protein
MRIIGRVNKDEGIGTRENYLHIGSKPAEENPPMEGQTPPM